MRNIDEAAEREAARISRRELDPQVIHRRLQGTIRSLERRPRPRLLGGVRIDVRERRFELSPDGRELRYHYEIGPNTNGAFFGVTAGTYPIGRTYDLRHPMLQGSGINNLGPYRLYATRLPQMNTERLELAPNRATWAGRARRDQRWAACVANPSFQPESYHWHSRNRRFMTRGNPNSRRVRARVDYMIARVNNLRSTASSSPANVRALLGHDEARSLRAFTTVRAEDRLGGHGYSRHVMGRPGIGDTRDLAQRAAFQRVVVRGIVERAGTQGGPATAYRNEADANMILASGVARLQAAWHNNRARLAAGNNVSMIIRHRNVDVIRADRSASFAAPGGPLPANRSGHTTWPGHLRAGVYTDPLQRTNAGVVQAMAANNPLVGAPTGLRPLSDTPRDMRSWRRWYRRTTGAAPPPPTTVAGQPQTNVSNVQANRSQAYFNAVTNRGTHGVRLETLYPLP